MANITRRDFLKLAGGTIAGVLAGNVLSSLAKSKNSKPSIIVIVCDALSARNVSLYGYPRKTTPHIDAFADRAIVYHRHVSGGNFTTTGTATLFTGMNGWKHRAINQGGLITSEFASANPFARLGADYTKFAFAQNPWSDRLIGQTRQQVDTILPVTAYSLRDENFFTGLFQNDRALASIAVDDFLFPLQGNTAAGSSIIGAHYKRKASSTFLKSKNESARYPDGLPEILISGYVAPYLNETVYNGVFLELEKLEAKNAPFFAFFHLFSPHFPYNPRREYLKLFRDDYAPPSKPAHPFSSKLNDDFLLARRTAYDRQIAQVDEEFGRLIASLDKIGALANSYLIFTSDHGEMFERGYAGHGFEFMYEPVLHIPLLIHAPGQSTRSDVFSPTSAADILPTLLHIDGKEISSDIDGMILPQLGGVEKIERPIFSIYAVDNSVFGALKKTVIAMRKGNHKLIVYLGYENLDRSFELYDLTNDPEELTDLAGRETNLLSQLKQEFQSHLEEANRPFIK